MVSPPRMNSRGPEGPAKEEASRLTAERGIILEIAGGQAVLLTPNGSFVKLPVQATSWEIGQEVVLVQRGPSASAVLRPGAGRRPWNLARGWARLRVAAVAAGLVIALMVPGMYLYANRPLPAMAYVSVDINPGVDLGVDARGRVVSAEPTNEDGSAVLTRARVLRLQLEQALKNLTEAAIQAGFLTSQNSLVVVAAVPVSEGQALPPTLDRTIEKAKSDTQSFLKQKNLAAVVQTIITDEATRQEAKSHNMSVGRYAIYLTAVSEGLPISLKDFQQGVGQAIRKAGGQVGEIAGKAHERRDYKELSEKFKKKIEEDEQEVEKAEKGESNGAGMMMQSTGRGQTTETPGEDNGKKIGRPSGSETDRGEGEKEGQDGEEQKQKEGTGEGTRPESDKSRPAEGGQRGPGQAPSQPTSPGEGGAVDRPKTERIAFVPERPNEPPSSFGPLSLDDRYDRAREGGSAKRGSSGRRGDPGRSGEQASERDEGH